MNSLSTRPLSHFFHFSSPFHRRRHHHILLLLRLAFSASSLSPEPPSSASSAAFRRSRDEESRAVRVSVWWDFENCTLPAGVNAFKVAHCVTSAVRASGIKGPVQITAFGDVFQLARPNQEALSTTGVTLIHVPRGGKNSADRSLLVDLMCWISRNPPPAHLFLISGDRDFAGILHRLRMSNYNILLACPDSAPSVLCSAASITWHWNALIKGEKFSGRHFNQPPDGPFSSWYGQYKGILEDPYAGVEPPASTQGGDKAAVEPGSAAKVMPGPGLRTIPKDVLEKMSRIVKSHPEGTPVSGLRFNMLCGKVRMDKNFYGYKSFSGFLLANPHIAKLKRGPNGRFLVFPASHRASKLVECTINGETQDFSVTTKPKAEPNSQEAEPIEAISHVENQDLAASLASKTEANSVTVALDEKPQLSSSVDVDGKEKRSDMVFDKKGTYAQLEEGNRPSEKLLSGEASGAHETENHIASVGNQDAEAEMGYFQKVWTKWFGKRDMDSNKKTLTYAPQPSNFGERHVAMDSFQSSDTKVPLDEQGTTRSIDHDDESNHRPGVFAKVLSWFKLSRSESDANMSNESIEKFNKRANTKRDELFLKDSFWNDIKSFLKTYKGSKIIQTSRARKEIAQNLRKEGPLVIKSLEENDLLHLIDLLISEKKWIVECPSRTSPFRFIQPCEGDAESTQSNVPSRLRSIILGSSSQPDKLPEQDKGETQNSPRPKVSTDLTKIPFSKQRDEILADCRNLVDDMFKERPQGINIRIFKGKFFERYGYILDYQKLGYQKMASLLQTVPGVRVEGNYFYSASTVAKEPIHEELNWMEDKQTSDETGKQSVAFCSKDEENDSPWEELGPVNSSVLSSKDNCESLLSDDDLSDSEGEVPFSCKEDHSKMRKIKEEGSLLQLLDSWHHKNENNKRDHSDKKDDLGHSNTSSSKTLTRKRTLGKSYSFVLDSDEDSKDKLLDGVLNSLKKSGKQRMPM